VKVFRTDNGGKYTLNDFEVYLRKEGIKHEYSIPKNPQQNGVSERMNCTLIECLRSMLAESRLPNGFWAEALSTAAYLIKLESLKSSLKRNLGLNIYEYWNVKLMSMLQKMTERN